MSETMCSIKPTLTSRAWWARPIKQMSEGMNGWIMINEWMNYLMNEMAKLDQRQINQEHRSISHHHLQTGNSITTMPWSACTFIRKPAYIEWLTITHLLPHKHGPTKSSQWDIDWTRRISSDWRQFQELVHQKTVHVSLPLTTRELHYPLSFSSGWHSNCQLTALIQHFQSQIYHCNLQADLRVVRNLGQ